MDHYTLMQPVMTRLERLTGPGWMIADISVIFATMDTSSTNRIWAVLADVLLGLHVGIVVFIVGGLLLIWAGAALGRPWVRNRCFRRLHLGAMGVVLLQALVGVICPLTQWEAYLRERAGQPTYGEATFMQYWLQRLLYQDWSPATFTVLYLFFFVAMVLTYRFIPPRPNSGAQTGS